MASKSAEKQGKVRGKNTNTHSPPDLTAVIEQTTKLWCKHHLDYDQTKYVVEKSRKALQLVPRPNRQRTVDRLDSAEVEKLIQAAYRLRPPVWPLD